MLQSLAMVASKVAQHINIKHHLLIYGIKIICALDDHNYCLPYWPSPELILPIIHLIHSAHHPFSYPLLRDNTQKPSIPSSQGHLPLASTWTESSLEPPSIQVVFQCNTYRIVLLTSSLTAIMGKNFIVLYSLVI